MMVFIFNVKIWNFACCMMRSFTIFVENIINVSRYTVTPVWTFNISKVWKSRCHNVSTRARYGDILMLYDMINTYGWFFCYNWHELRSSYKSVDISSMYCFWPITTMWVSSKFRDMAKAELLIYFPIFAVMFAMMFRPMWANFFITFWLFVCITSFYPSLSVSLTRHFF